MRPCHPIRLDLLPPLKSDGVGQTDDLWVGDSKSDWKISLSVAHKGRKLWWRAPPYTSFPVHTPVWRISGNIEVVKNGTKTETQPTASPILKDLGPVLLAPRLPLNTASHIPSSPEWMHEALLTSYAQWLQASFPLKHRTWLNDAPSDGSFLSLPHPLKVWDTGELNSRIWCQTWPSQLITNMYWASITSETWCWELYIHSQVEYSHSPR